MRLSLAEVLEATGGGVRGGTELADSFLSFHTDSRQVRPGGLFFALKGAQTDGHAFIGDAAQRGAAGVVVCEDAQVSGGVAEVVVGDTWRALYDLAGFALRRTQPLVVGVTGSNGKTTTKEMMAAVLGLRHRVLKTEGNLNTETGVPLTLLALEPGHTALVLEMALQGPGEIARLAELARPEVGIVTTVGSVHLEFFKSRRALARAKGELVERLPADGRAVLNAEGEFFRLLSGLSRAPVTSFGLERGDLRGEGYRSLPEGGCAFSVRGVEVRLRLAGRHQARNALAALAAGEHAGVELPAGAGALAEVAVEHRLQELETPAGFRVVDDSYNASPESMLAAFEVLAERPRPARLLAVLGEMRELGGVAESAHREVGQAARRLFDQVCVVDAGWGKQLAKAAGAELVSDREAAEAWVRRHAGPGSVVLVKASHGLRLDLLVQRLLGR